MKKLLKKSLVLFLALIFVVMSVLPVAASQATSYSYTLDDEGELVRTSGCLLTRQNYNKPRIIRSGRYDYR